MGWERRGKDGNRRVYYRKKRVGPRCQSLARVVISQLEGDGVPLPMRPPAPTPENGKKPAPTKEEVRQQEYNRRAECVRKPSKIECFPPPETCEKDKEGFTPTSVQKGAQ